MTNTLRLPHFTLVIPFGYQSQQQASLMLGEWGNGLLNRSRPNNGTNCKQQNHQSCSYESSTTSQYSQYHHTAKITNKLRILTVDNTYYRSHISPTCPINCISSLSTASSQPTRQIQTLKLASSFIVGRASVAAMNYLYVQSTCIYLLFTHF